MQHDDLPPPPRLLIERSSLLNAAVLLIGTIALIYAVVFLYRWATEPIAMTPSPSPSLDATAVTSTYPAEFIQMAVAVSTSLAPSPTPLPPTPTYAMMPTPKPPDVCLTSTPRGSVCTQPEPPLPTNTPMADCPVSPGELCVWRGGPIVWLTSTPGSSMSLNP